MAKIEVDEAEFNQMVALRGIASKMTSKPESRRLLEQAHKLVDPNASTPLLDEEARRNEPINALQTQLSTELAALKKERDDEKREQTLATLAARQNDAFARLRRAGYTDEGVVAVQKLMETKGLLDVDDAVAIFEKQNPPQTPSMPSGGMTGTAWGFVTNNDESDKDIQALIASKGENDAVTDRMASRALNEFRSRR